MPDEEDVLAYAYMAEHVFHLPMFYMEYSGKYGDKEVVKRVKEELNDTKFFTAAELRRGTGKRNETIC